MVYVPPSEMVLPTWSDNTSPWRQQRLGDIRINPHDGVGDVVSGLSDIEQCINVILRTPKGTDPHRPDFACDLLPYLDWPIDRATPHLVRESIKAITKWEPRIVLARVGVRLDPAIASAVIAVNWKLRDGTFEGVTEVSI